MKCRTAAHRDCPPCLQGERAHLRTTEARNEPPTQNLRPEMGHHERYPRLPNLVAAHRLVDGQVHHNCNPGYRGSIAGGLET
ncbi:MAG: hypothetical protein QXT77_08105 [Candidatus Methanomethylicaceae archaeon]